MYKIPDKTVFMGKKIISLPACESTNSLMISMAQGSRLDEGTIIVTENQTVGRGQAGNQWISEPGANLTFSVLLKPGFLEPNQQFYLNMAVGLGICDAVSEIILTHKDDLEVKLKWPNDVLVNGKKVCGILIENQVQGQQYAQAVAGIGLNVNQTNFEWPLASSLSLCAEADLDKGKLFDLLLTRLETRYEQLRIKSFKALKDDYYRILYWKDERHEFSSNGQTFTGTIKGIDEIGRLLVQDVERLQSFNFKEIKFLA